MKNIILFFCFLCLTTQLSAQTPSVNADEEAIKKVILDEGIAFLQGNIDAFMATYNASPNILWTVTNGMEYHL